MKLRLTAIFLICVIFMSLLFSCGGADGPVETGPAAPIPGAESVTGEISQPDGGEYIFPALDCGGGDFTFLNTSTDWGFYTDLVKEAVTGEVLDDAIYTRNRAIEDKFNVNIKEIPVLVDSSAQRLRTAVQAGENVYDAAYIPGNSQIPIGTLIADNLLYNLNEVPGLNLDQKWWNRLIIADSAIGSSKSLFFAFCDINIMPLQCAFCVYINEDIIKNLGLELPYGLVKEGKWTYDEFYRYMKAGAQLNGGADSFKWELNGPAIYGYTSFAGGTLALMTASGERGITIDDKGVPQFALESERFYNVCDKLSDILSTKSSGEHLTANDYGSGFHFEMIFERCRALMMGGELKAADSFRNMDNTYGIVPNPKFDEAQTRYYTAITVQSPVLVVPVTNTNTERAGTILDAMAYLSNRDITPVFFDVTMSQKRLRNEESIDMLHIIKDSLYFDLGIAYGWTSALVYAIRDTLDAGRPSNAASSIEKYRERVQADIDKTMEFID